MKTTYKWNENTNQGWQDFFQTDASSQLKREVSQSLGEHYGERYCLEKLGYTEILTGDSKGMKQGLDAVFFDEKTGDVVVAEFKGQSAKESEAQQRIDWSPGVCEKILNQKGVYGKASEPEWETAKIVMDAYEKGQLRYELLTTQVDKEGNLTTTHEKKHRPEESAEFRQEESGREQFNSSFSNDRVEAYKQTIDEYNHQENHRE
jgi:hypothetical protein